MMARQRRMSPQNKPEGTNRGRRNQGRDSRKPSAADSSKKRKIEKCPLRLATEVTGDFKSQLHQLAETIWGESKTCIVWASVHLT